jgi:hypothetical protein
MTEIESSFSSHNQIISGPPPRSIGINEEKAENSAILDDVEYRKSLWDPFRFDDDELYWKSNVNAGQFLQRVIGTCVGVTPNGRQYLTLVVEQFIAERASDPKTKKVIIVRRRLVGRSASGEPIYPMRRQAAWQFVSENSPQEHRISASEYEALLKHHASLIKEEREVWESERAAHQHQNEMAVRATVVAQDPQKALGTAIAQGVAEALAKLGVTPNKT